MWYILITLYILSCFILIAFVLLQPGKSDAAAVFGGGANSSAFGPRGTQTVLAKVTITAAITFFLIAFLFSIPGLFQTKSAGESLGPAQSQPAPVDTTPAPDTVPVTPPATPPASEVKPPDSGAAKSGADAQTKPAPKKK